MLRDVTVEAATWMGFRIRSYVPGPGMARRWWLRTPFAGDIPCPTLGVALSTLRRILA